MLERGRDGRFTIDIVARRAGVARMTIYNQFGSLAGLLEAMFDDVAGAFMAQRMPRVFQEPQLEEALRLFVETFAELWARSPRLFQRLIAFAAFDPNVTAIFEERNQRRLTAATNLFSRAWPEGAPAPWESLGEAARALAALTSYSSWRAMQAPGESPEVATDRLVRIALQLFAPNVHIGQSSPSLILPGKDREGAGG